MVVCTDIRAYTRRARHLAYATGDAIEYRRRETDQITVQRRVASALSSSSESCFAKAPGAKWGDMGEHIHKAGF